MEVAWKNEEKLQLNSFRYAAKLQSPTACTVILASWRFRDLMTSPSAHHACPDLRSNNCHVEEYRRSKEEIEDIVMMHGNSVQHQKMNNDISATRIVVCAAIVM